MTAVQRQDLQSCAVLSLNRPDVRNAMNDAIVSELERHLDAIEQDSTRAIIITGSGKGFCAGTDLKEMLALGYEGYQQRIGRMHSLFTCAPFAVYPLPPFTARPWAAVLNWPAPAPFAWQALTPSSACRKSALG